MSFLESTLGVFGGASFTGFLPSFPTRLGQLVTLILVEARYCHQDVT